MANHRLIRFGWCISTCLAISACSSTTHLYSSDNALLRNLNPGCALHADTDALVANWLKLFPEPSLQALLHSSFIHNNSIAAARASLISAQELLSAQTKQTYYPNLQLQTTILRGNHVNQMPLSSVHNLITPALNLRYDIDLFGGSKQLLNKFNAQVAYKQYLLAGAYLDLSANIVHTLLQLGFINDSIAVMHTMVTLSKQEIKIAEQQVKLGAMAGTTLLSMQSAASLIIAKLPQLQQTRAELINLLQVLLGLELGQSKVVNISLANFNLPPKIKYIIPAHAAQQRPDVRAALALMRSANAEVGVASANLFPKLSLSANYAWSAEQLEQLFNHSNLIWNMGASLLQPLFNAGSLRAQRRAAIADWYRAAAEYRNVLLKALADISNSLQQLHNDRQFLSHLNASYLMLARKALISGHQVSLGSMSYAGSLALSLQAAQAQLDLLAAQLKYFDDAAKLFQVTGGVWY